MFNNKLRWWCSSFILNFLSLEMVWYYSIYYISIRSIWVLFSYGSSWWRILKKAVLSWSTLSCRPKFTTDFCSLSDFYPPTWLTQPLHTNPLRLFFITSLSKNLLHLRNSQSSLILRKSCFTHIWSSSWSLLVIKKLDSFDSKNSQNGDHLKAVSW